MAPRANAKMVDDVLDGPVAEIERLRRDGQGAITNPKVERYALLLADDVPATDAWRLAGYVTSSSGRGRDWRRRVEMDPVFKERVGELMEERKVLEASRSPFADARWTAKQMWRDARAQGDLREAGRASDLLFKIAERELDWSKAQGFSPGPEEAEGRGPGRPPNELQQTREAPPAEIMKRLMDKGRGEAAAA